MEVLGSPGDKMGFSLALLQTELVEPLVPGEEPEALVINLAVVNEAVPEGLSQMCVGEYAVLDGMLSHQEEEAFRTALAAPSDAAASAWAKEALSSGVLTEGDPLELYAIGKQIGYAEPSSPVEVMRILRHTP